MSDRKEVNLRAMNGERMINKREKKSRKEHKGERNKVIERKRQADRKKTGSRHIFVVIREKLASDTGLSSLMDIYL